MRSPGIIPGFFSRDRKPSLKLLACLTIVFAAAIAVLAVTGAEEHACAICFTIAVYALAVAAALLFAFRQQVGYDPYSYNTIFYAGFSLFAFFIMLMHLVLGVDMIKAPDIYQGIMVIHVLMGSAKNYMFFSAPFLLLFSAGLSISNVSLILHEGKRLVNLLGIILSFLIICGWLSLFYADYYVSGSQMEVMIHELLTNLFAAIYLYFECMLIGTIIADIIAARYEPHKDRDFVIILGCGIRDDGTPTPLLRSRIDRALQFAEAQKELTGKELTFITSGGQGSDEVISESACMRQYLMEQGVPPERIIEENRSVSTFENMKFSKEKIDERDPNAKIAFSTNNYHVFRSGFFAGTAGMRAAGMGARTKWYFWPNAAVREFAGLLTKQKGRQLLILCCMIVFYIILTFLVYLVY
ncbi:MAG: YdcF family protein [Lachnospiraceae bacterium]|nr:YdcF family protein [Lachnospiraceae bacterium]